MKIKFCGAAGEVTGSCTLLEAEGKKILIDCGLFQGSQFATSKNAEDFPFKPSEIDIVLLTHAHQDHCGRLPKLYKDGFRGKIYATEPTIELTNVMLADSAHIMEEDYRDEGLEPLYSEKDLLSILPLFKKTDYQKKIKITPNMWVQFRNAGHILGAAIIEIWAEGKKIVFSGDLGHESMLLIKKIADIKEADYIICESTYGDRLHKKTINDKKQIIKSAIDETISKKGVLLFPAFALERTQEILYELNSLVENTEIGQIDIFVDSPLAIRITKIFDKYQDFYNLETKKRILAGDDIFEFKNLQYTPEVTQSKYINNSPKPKVIIAGSGMCSGGRIMYHLERYLPDPTTNLYFLGYQVKGTRGRDILDGVKNISIKGRKTIINAKISMTEIFSGHADQSELIGWLGHFKAKTIKQVFLNHGDEESREALAKIIKDKFSTTVKLPKINESFEI
ncbi:MBL fold metallo-hydrolase [Patescibacteria group bacterium]